ncbi:MAG: (2Fe-2S) ferredoxin domain-containing protein [Candidatus Diapherotrites archaeon]|nr:(2Fe-2S) ferredoxin domain-containing protein [Candidatus Diapherotrites archaeon]
MVQYQRHVLVCTNEKPGHCGANGGLLLYDAFKAAVLEHGLSDSVLVSKTGCTKQHHLGCAVIVHPDGVWYKGVAMSDVAEIVESHLQDGKIVERLRNPNIGVAAKQ